MKFERKYFLSVMFLYSVSGIGSIAWIDGDLSEKTHFIRPVLHLINEFMI
jgi:hypothetical protein